MAIIFIGYELTTCNLIGIVTCIPIAKQRLGRYIPAKSTRATEGRSLLSNGPVDTPP
jgi:hypothetical protein